MFRCLSIYVGFFSFLFLVSETLANAHCQNSLSSAQRAAQKGSINYKKANQFFTRVQKKLERGDKANQEMCANFFKGKALEEAAFDYYMDSLDLLEDVEIFCGSSPNSLNFIRQMEMAIDSSLEMLEEDNFEWEMHLSFACFRWSSTGGQ